MMHYGVGYGFMGFGWLFQILILVLFFLVIYWLMKSSGKFGLNCAENDSALEILNKRLAKGEINVQEYEKLKKEIQKD